MANAALINKGSVQDFYGQPAAPASPPSGQARAYYNSTTDLFHIIDSTGADIVVASSVSGVAFSGVTAGTNTSALIIGTGGSLSVSGSGTITATAVPAAGVTVGTFVSGQTLVAPLLGTPASGVLTNCTGLPAAAVVAGTLVTNMAFTIPTTYPVSSQAVTSYLSIGGGLAGFIEDFYSCGSTTISAAQAGPNGDTGWSSAPITGGTTATIAAAAGGASTFQNPGSCLFTTTAVSGQGIALYKGAGSNSGAAFGFLGANANWQLDIWLQLPATITNYCFRAGYCIAGQQATDALTGGTYFEFDTANTGNTDSKVTFVTRAASTSTYNTTTCPTATASHFYHLRIFSTVSGQVSFQIGDNNGALGAAQTAITSNLDTTHACMPFIQLIPRTTAAVTLTVDRYSFLATTGRV